MSTGEHDWGWVSRSDGRKARLSWRSDGGVVYLFHAGSGVEEELARGVEDGERREFWELLDDARPLDVAAVRTAAGEWFS